MPKTQYELNAKAKEIITGLEGYEYWEAESILGLAKQELHHNAIIKRTELADVCLPSEPHNQEQLQS